MKMIKLYYSITFCFILMNYSPAQSNLVIDGGNITVIGNANLVLKDAQFLNNGSFEAGNGTVTITGAGTDEVSAIGGTSGTTFYNLQIKKTTNGTQLQKPIQVDNELRMTSGNLDLNGNDLTLGEANGTIVGESETSRITGEGGGEVIITQELNAPTAVNPGNIGVVITSDEDLGATTIKRGHVPETIAGNAGIERYYEITPTNNTDLDATTQFQYFQAELNGIQEADLGLWRKDDDFWFNPAATITNPTNNYIETTNINLFSKWTLATDAPKLSLTVFLQGPYSTADLDMNDDLRVQDLLGSDEPYAALGYNHVSSGGGESVVNDILNIATQNAIVDWVFVELRDATDNTIVVAARSALLQKDGDVVDLDGVSPLSFPGITKGNSYFIAVRHRNHLGVMTASTEQLN